MMVRVLLLFSLQPYAPTYLQMLISWSQLLNALVIIVVVGSYRRAVCRMLGVNRPLAAHIGTAQAQVHVTTATGHPK